MTREELDRIKSVIERAYHRAATEFELPTGGSLNGNHAYNASAEDGLKWSEPMRPEEIANLVESECSCLVVDPLDDALDNVIFGMEDIAK